MIAKSLTWFSEISNLQATGDSKSREHCQKYKNLNDNFYHNALGSLPIYCEIIHFLKQTV